MNNNKNKTILISSAIVYTQRDDKTLWFLVKQGEESGWEIPKTAVRRGESSVRAVIRAMGEQGGMRARILEEVGRSGGSSSINGKIVTQRTIFYLMLQRGESHVLGFAESEWLEYAKAQKRLTSKKDQAMLEKARDLMKEIQKTRKNLNIEEDEDEDEDELLAELEN